MRHAPHALLRLLPGLLRYDEPNNVALVSGGMLRDCMRDEGLTRSVGAG